MTKGLNSTIVKIIPEADLKILKKYLNPKYINVVLVPEKIFAQLQQERISAKELKNTKYDFGGGPDYYVDLVKNRQHHFVREARNQKNGVFNARPKSLSVKHEE
jgi:hypothetical protein